MASRQRNSALGGLVPASATQKAIASVTAALHRPWLKRGYERSFVTTTYPDVYGLADRVHAAMKYQGKARVNVSLAEDGYLVVVKCTRRGAIPLDVRAAIDDVAG